MQLPDTENMGADPELFEITMAVEAADIDENGHVNNVSYVRWVQDVAAAHWRSAAPAADQAALVWIVLRHEIDYKKAAHLGDTVLARTWVGSASRVRFERHTELYRSGDGVLLAKARSVWCPIDRRTGKPANVSAEVRSRFSARGS